ncbi:MAG: beta-carotene 15,15'-monooxygenase [Dethiosulfovibrio peptidovorans]|nr:MAG: beta-carotene 15,15'-monooxygenase [Dethiosulfovibrio peptidovorans]
MKEVFSLDQTTAQAMVTSPVGIMALVSLMIAFSLHVQRYKTFQKLGPAITCIIAGIILSNTKILPFNCETYGTFFKYGIPLTLTMFLLSVNIKEWIKLAQKPLIAMLFACISVCFMATVAGMWLAPKLPEGWKIAGMFVGTYTGGSSNLTAIGTGLEVSPTTFGAANAADYALGIPLTILLFALPGLFMNSQKLQKWWPYKLSKSELYDEQARSIYEAKEWSVNDVAMLFMLGFLVNAGATWVASFFGKGVTGAVRVVCITTFALALAQIEPIRKTRGSREMGIFISMFYLAAIGLGIDIKQFLEAAPLITFMCAIVSIGCLILHLTLCRLFKIPYEYVIASITASIADGTTSALVCASANWTGIIGTAIVLGAIGNALGNYMGIGVAFFVKSFCGL